VDECLRIIPSYTAYRLARGANLKCGCSYGRRLFIKGLISLALTAVITQKIPLAWGRGEGRHPLSKVKIVKTLRLEGNDLEDAVKRMRRSIDVKNIVDVSQIDSSNAIAAKHILEFNNEENTIIAVGSTLINKSETVVYYELEKPIEWLKTEAKTIIHSSNKYIVKEISINGRRIRKSRELGQDYSEGPCIEGCSNEWDCGGPPNSCATYCCNGDDLCLMKYCGAPCTISCISCIAGDLEGCIYCVLCAAVTCPWLLEVYCCYEHGAQCVYYQGP